jgi:uncharacterized protein YndB with AHSA1/START domain
MTQTVAEKIHATANGARELVITRTLDAPRDLVWKALTEPERLEHWWGPKGFTSSVHKLELRPGGTFLFCHRSSEGREMWGKWVYREIVAPERLVVVSSFTDKNGNPTRHPFNPNWPLELLTTSTFTEQPGRTTLTVRMVPINATDSERETFLDGFKFMEEGFTGTFEKLDKYLTSL